MSKQLCGKIDDGTGAPDNCCPPSSCGLIYQKKAATATLCGVAEYASPSSPPKKYRTETASGYLHACNYTAACATMGSAAGTKFGWRGTKSYDPASCALTNTEYEDIYFSDGGAGCGVSASPDGSNLIVGAWSPSNTSGAAQTLSPTANIWTATGNCVVGPNQIWSGIGRADLTNEDTEDDAIARANAGIGSWTSCTSNCISYKEARGAGDFALAYQSIQFKVVATGGVDGTTYEATLNLRKRAQGSSDPWVDWAEMYHQFTKAIGTYTSDWIDLPCESGYEVEISACWVRIDT